MYTLRICEGKWCHQTILTVFIVLAVTWLAGVWWARVNENRRWINHQQDVIRQTFRSPRYDSPLPTPSPKPSVFKPKPESEEYEQNCQTDYDVKYQETPHPYSSPDRPTTPAEKNPWEKSTVVPASPVRRSEFLTTPPPSPVERLYNNTIGRVFLRRAKAEYPDREFLRVYECGRMHTSPEDHAMLCAPNDAFRRKAVYDRDQRAARWTHERRARSKSKSRALF
jgi:hypothetical protein